MYTRTVLCGRLEVVERRVERFHIFTNKSVRHERKLTDTMSQSTHIAIDAGEPKELAAAAARDVDRSTPFIRRFPNTAFGVVLGLGGNSILWKVSSWSVVGT